MHMHLFSLKQMVLYVAISAVAHFGSTFADHGHHHHHHHHKKGHDHKCHDECHDRCNDIKCCPTAHEVRTIEGVGIGLFERIIGNLNNAFIAEAFTTDAGTAVSSFVAAELGTNAGGAGQFITEFAALLASLHVDQSAIDANTAALQTYLTAGNAYSMAVSTNDSSQTALFNTWLNAANALSGTLVNLCNLNASDTNTIQAQVSDMTINLGQAILGYNLATGFDANSAVAAFLNARNDVASFSSIVFNCLLNKSCHHCN